MFHTFMSSLLAQTHTDLEIILVNDGLTDGSKVLAHDYAERYAHVRVIDQPNGGVSRAHNAGLATMRGVYITFPDADDMLYPTLY